MLCRGIMSSKLMTPLWNITSNKGRAYLTCCGPKRVRALDRVNVNRKRRDCRPLWKEWCGQDYASSTDWGCSETLRRRVKTVGRVYKLRGANPGLINSMTPRENVRLLASALME